MHKVGFFRSIQLKFIIIFILLLLVTIQVIGAYFVRGLETELRENFEESVEGSVSILEVNLEQAFSKERSGDDDELTLPQEVQNIVRVSDTADITNIQVVNMQSRIIASSDTSNTSNIGKKTTDEFINNVLRFGNEEKGNMLREGIRIYRRTVPIYDDDTQVGALYIEASLEGVYNQLDDINRIFLQGSILAITVSALLGILVARTITKPIMEMRRQAQTMAREDFSQKVNVYGKDEIGQLAETFNDLNAKLKHSRALTEEERRKLSSVLSNMSDGVIATDRNGFITLLNDAAGFLIGYEPEDAHGEFLLDALQLDENSVDITELPDSGSMVIDFSDDDDIYLVRAKFSTISDEDNETTGFITVLSDVTEQEKIERDRREFVSNVSHELRTPLTTMRSYIEALTEGAWEDKEIAPKFLDVTKNETDRMIRMVNDLLQLSRMDNKSESLQQERTNFIDFFHRVIDRFEMNISDKMELKRELPNEKYHVMLDKDKMVQVLDNIISNAIKYSPEDGTIHFKVSQRRGYVLVSVTDQGTGIPYDKVDKIFDRFYRADKARSRKVGGTGLGLAITKEFIEAHHGSIWAKSKEGKGTTILFTLPLVNKKRRGK
ncbi:cell wall metabolism sensor histidine kinase WalK [Lentibacillus sp. CBA3610]|uniref:cell wall metabolism sensor histidine kinase WalK n=1 Tax=Lentibacillus sp. CBA3610 TaxID=2518176 RepID=UPI0015957A1F|nr:cell wall metabolism sensor histidine kinase WalK [Lentibacillus sp. CBA3610]QKY70808.1 cell wall metabolism sensor histidine kinase WalK [Lentibacillus sp. CBA3610]